MRLKNIKRIVTYNLPLLLCVTLCRRFPKLFDGFSVKPADANVKITGMCNLKCRMCGVWRGTEKEELTTQQWKDTFDQLKTEGVRNLYITGGEPLLRKDLPLLSKHARSLGFDVDITTNGYLLTEEAACDLIDAGATSFSISIDALGHDFDTIRGVQGSYERALSACRTLVKIRRTRDIFVTICPTIMRPSLPHLVDIAKFAQALRIPVIFNLVTFTPIHLQKARSDDLWINRQDYDYLDKVVDELVMMKRRNYALFKQTYGTLRFIKQYFREPLQKNIPCASSWTRLFIDHQGKIYGGCWAMGSFGQLPHDKLSRILRSKKYRSARRAMLLKECPGCSCGYPKNIYYALSWLVRECKYRLAYLRG